MDRYHEAGNMQALQYLCKKWFGSVEEMWDFAQFAVNGAPAGASIQILPLNAVIEHLIEEGGPALTSNPERVEDAVRRGYAFLEANPDADYLRTAPIRNVLTRVLFHLERPHEAYEQLLAIGPHATDLPWGFWGDAREEFLKYRGYIVALKAGSS